MMRYFRASSTVYESLNAQLDAAYGYPNAATKTARTLPPATELPQDSGGRVYLAITAVYCDYVLPSEMLPPLLASGAVEEITAELYREALALLPAE
jgi:hypothetical protein